MGTELNFYTQPTVCGEAATVEVGVRRRPPEADDTAAAGGCAAGASPPPAGSAGGVLASLEDTLHPMSGTTAYGFRQSIAGSADEPNVARCRSQPLRLTPSPYRHQAALGRTAYSTAGQPTSNFATLQTNHAATQRTRHAVAEPFKNPKVRFPANTRRVATGCFPATAVTRHSRPTQ